jgi:hypothetical protein
VPLTRGVKPDARRKLPRFLSFIFPHSITQKICSIPAPSRRPFQSNTREFAIMNDELPNFHCANRADAFLPFPYLFYARAYTYLWLTPSTKVYAVNARTISYWPFPTYFPASFNVFSFFFSFTFGISGPSANLRFFPYPLASFSSPTRTQLTFTWNNNCYSGGSNEKR